MTKTKVRRIVWWGLFTAWLVLTVFLSCQNADGSASLSRSIARSFWHAMRNVFGESVFNIRFYTFHVFFRKATHFCVHFVLAFLLVRASCWTYPSRKTAMCFAWTFAIVIALVDETMQLIAPGRASALFDAGLNLSGAVLGAFISSLFGPRNLEN